MTIVSFGDSILDRMVLAVEKVRDRLKRTTRTLAAAGIRHAVVGGNAVAAWVAKVDTAAVRNTQDMDILIDRKDLEAAKEALEAVGFIYRHVKSIDMFLDGPKARARDAVYVIFANEKVRSESLCPLAGNVVNRKCRIGICRNFLCGVARSLGANEAHGLSR